MKKFNVVIILLFLALAVQSQRYMFGTGGTMSKSAMYVDTIMKTKLKHAEGIHFLRLDQFIADVPVFKTIIPLKYYQHDTLSYFILANFSSSPVGVSRINTHLVTEELAQFEDQYYRPTNFFIYPRCGFAITEDILLRKGEVMIIRDYSARPGTNAGILVNTRLRLKTSTGILVSEQYIKRVMGSDFFFPKEYEGDFRMAKSRLAFNN